MGMVAPVMNDAALLHSQTTASATSSVSKDGSAPGQLNNLQITTDGRIMARGQTDHILLYDLTTGKELRKFVPAEQQEGQPVMNIGAFLFSPDGKWLLGLGNINNAPQRFIWEASTGKLTSISSEAKNEKNTPTGIRLQPA